MKRLLLIYLVLLTTCNAYTQTVYITPSGEKYHLGNCRMVKNVSQAIAIDDAVKKGKQPCKICKPPVSFASNINSTNKPQGTDKTTYQCMGKTKKGIRCQHRTKIANGYCFQHNPDKQKN